jgi:Bacterial alpha-L-rhamnosidase 6 hairpin glycosidase domain
MTVQANDDHLRDARRAASEVGQAMAHSAGIGGRLPFYRLRSDRLAMGASLGNGHCWITTRGRGAIDGFFSTDLGRTVMGAVLVRYSGLGSRLVISGDHKTAAGRGAYAQLLPDQPGEVVLHPAYQRHRFTLPGDLDVQQTLFVPKRPPRHGASREQSSAGQEGDPAVAYQWVELTNKASEPRSVRVYGFAQLRGDTAPDLQAHYLEERRALVASNASQPNWVRVFGATVPVTAYETTSNASQISDISHMCPLTNDTSVTGGHMLGALQVDLDLRPGERREIAFVMAFSADGEEAALATFAAALDVRRALDETIAFYQEMVRPAEVLTPDPVINDGAVWAKVNMLRVMADYPTGPAFTNNPSHSSAVVGRDAFWFVYGCDHLREAFSCHLLRNFARRQEKTGKIVEFYNAVTGESEDDGLNINDNTPLFILAVNHHWRSSGHWNCLNEFYPAVIRAARHIVSQENEQGLVWCTATGEETHGIIGWRNIIPHWRISGAVTEVNAECAAALRAAGHMAENLGRADEAEEFRAAAVRLTQAINEHLLNPENGMYYLDIDVDGMVRTDVTADEVFPVMFRVAPEGVAFRIVSRLNVSDFWTEAGLRTVSTEDVEYDPSGRLGLLGGVWPGVTWWYAFAAARYHPEAMVKALRASFAHYARDPKIHDTVPGQFSEWFDGESLVNRGMRLSPWEPPRYLWAAVEGICGVMVRPYPELPRVQLLLPMDWKWVGLRNLAYQGRSISYFGARMVPSARRAAEQAKASQKIGNRRRGAGLYTQLYANAEIQLTEGHAVETYAEDISDRIRVQNDALRAVAFARPGEVLVCIGNTAAQTSIGGVELDDVLAPGSHYHVHLYNSESDTWSHVESGDTAELVRVAVVVEAGGFRIARLREVS